MYSSCRQKVCDIARSLAPQSMHRCLQDRWDSSASPSPGLPPDKSCSDMLDVHLARINCNCCAEVRPLRRQLPCPLFTPPRHHPKSPSTGCHWLPLALLAAAAAAILSDPSHLQCRRQADDPVHVDHAVHLRHRNDQMTRPRPTTGQPDSRLGGNGELELENRKRQCMSDHEKIEAPVWA